MELRASRTERPAEASAEIADVLAGRRGGGIPGHGGVEAGDLAELEPKARLGRTSEKRDERAKFLQKEDDPGGSPARAVITAA
jgi:hypothetical protein